MTDTAKLARQLTARLAELGGNIAVIEKALRAPLDADFAEQAAELESQDALGGIEASHREEARAIEAALQRIAEGNYGLCSRCGREIPEKRLEALPTATTCVVCPG